MFKRRPDGIYLKDLSALTKITPYVMPSRIGASIYTEQEFDITETLQFLRRFNKERAAAGKVKITFFQLFVVAYVRTMALRPKMNRFIMGYRFWQRKSIRVGFIAKKELSDEGEEIFIIQDYSPFETLHSIGEKFITIVRESTRGEGNESEDLNVFLMKLPRFLARFVFWCIRTLDYWNMLPASVIQSSPFHSSIILTNVGSVGVEAPFHHLYELGTTGIFVSLGIIRRVKKPDKKGQIVDRDVVKVICNYDERIADGIYAGRSFSLFRKLVENPEELLDTPQLSDAILAELNIKDPPSESGGGPNE